MKTEQYRFISGIFDVWVPFWFYSLETRKVKVFCGEIIGKVDEGWFFESSDIFPNHILFEYYDIRQITHK